MLSQSVVDTLGRAGVSDDKDVGFDRHGNLLLAEYREPTRGQTWGQCALVTIV